MAVGYTETVLDVNGNYTVLDIPTALLLGDYASMEFGANIRRYRKAKGWNQGVLAERVGVAQATITRWETREREPSFDDLEKLARVLEVTVSDLFREGSVDTAPSASDLAGMVQRAMDELPVGVSFADYPTAVASSLHDQLAQYQAAGGFRQTEDEAISPDTDAPLPAPTKQSVGAGSRSR